MGLEPGLRTPGPRLPTTPHTLLSLALHPSVPPSFQTSPALRPQGPPALSVPQSPTNLPRLSLQLGPHGLHTPLRNKSRLGRRAPGRGCPPPHGAALSPRGACILTLGKVGFSDVRKTNKSAPHPEASRTQGPRSSSFQKFYFWKPFPRKCSVNRRKCHTQRQLFPAPRTGTDSKEPGTGCGELRSHQKACAQDDKNSCAVK